MQQPPSRFELAKSLLFDNRYASTITTGICKYRLATEKMKGFKCNIFIVFNHFHFLFLRVIENHLFTYDAQQAVKLIESFYSSERSLIQTHRKYPQHFNVRVSPKDNMIRKHNRPV